MKALTLWAPDLLHILRVKEASDALQPLSLPALQTLLVKSDKFPISKTPCFSHQASTLFHQRVTLPVAATEACVIFKDHEQGKDDFWIKVDAVQMVADRDSLVLISGKHLAINKQELEALLAAFNEHFAQDGVQLIASEDSSWYMSMSQPVDIKTTDLLMADNKPVNELYPQGSAAQYWRQMMNETQMLFYTHPVNEARRNKGWPEINSIWPWGEGQIDFDQISMRADAAIWSGHAYLQGLAKLTSAHHLDSPQCYSHFIEQLNTVPENVDNHLVLLDEIHEHLDSLEMGQWLQILETLEKNWFEPILSAMQKGQIDSLLLDLGGCWRYHLKPQHLKRFWRFKKSIYSITS